MDDRVLLRVAAASAVAGGALRIADAFLAKSLSGETLGPIYFVTDVLFLGALLGLYLPQRRALGWAGLASFAAAATGFLIVRSAEIHFFAERGGYLLGASIALLGTTALGVLLAIKGHQRVAAGIWLAALAAGIAGTCCAPAAREIDAAGILFGAGFVVAGAALARESNRL